MIAMREVTGYATKEDFAKGFVPAFKQAVRLAERKAAGADTENDSDAWLAGLKAEAEAMADAD
jgi:hypothetical protein